MDKDADRNRPTTEETAEILELEKLVRAEDRKRQEGGRPPQSPENA